MKHALALTGMAVGLVACGGGAAGGGGGGGGGAGPDVVAFIADARTPNVPELLVGDTKGQHVRVVSGPLVGTASVRAFAWNPARTRLAFVADREVNEHFELYVTDVATGVVTKRSNHASGDVEDDIAWSADGAYVGYRADTTSATRYEMWTVPAVGGAPALVSGTVVPNGDVLSFRWSPIGHRLAYVGDGTTDELYVVRLVDGNGGNWVMADIPVGSIPSADFEDDYAWRPDGGRIAYRFDPQGLGDKRLFSCLPDGTGLVTHTTPIGVGRTVDSFAWAPDSTKLAYVADQDTDNAYEVYVSPSAGGSQVKVGSAAATALCADLAWSPTSTRLAWRLVKLIVGSADLVTNLATGGSEAILRASALGRQVERFAWSPDGSLIAYTADVDTFEVFELYTVSPSNLLTLKRSMELEPAGSVESFAWAPNGVILLFTADDDVDGVRDLYASIIPNSQIVALTNEVSASEDVRQFEWTPDGTYVLVAASAAPFTPRAMGIITESDATYVNLTAGFPNLTQLEDFIPK